MNAVRELFVELGFKLNLDKFNKFNTSIDVAKQKFNNFASDVSKTVAPNLQNANDNKLKDLLAYENELSSLSSKERSDIKKLNSLEKQSINATLKEHKNKYNLIKAEEKKVLDLQRMRGKEQSKFFASQRTFGQSIKRLALTFGATFSIFSLFKSTLKDIETFKSKGSRNFSIFTKKDLQISTTFTANIKQASKNFSELRNSISIKLMPTMSTFLTSMNKFWLQNKDIIKQNIGAFIDTLVFSVKALISILSQCKNALDPVVGLFGGWSNALTAIIGISITRWIVGVVFALGGFLASTLSLTALLKNCGIVLVVLKAGLVAVRVAMIALAAIPLGLVIAGLIAAFALLASNLDLMIPLWDGMKSGIGSVVDQMKALWDWIIKAKDGLLNFPTTIKTKFERAFSESALFNPNQKAESNLKYLMKDGSYIQDNPFGEMARNVLSNKDALIDSSARSAITNNSTMNKKNITFAPKNNFSLNINVPSGSNESMIDLISSSIKNELEKYTTYENEKFLISIGADR